MKRLFSPNIGNKGRLIRGCGALVLLVGAGFGFIAHRKQFIACR